MPGSPNGGKPPGIYANNVNASRFEVQDSAKSNGQHQNRQRCRYSGQVALHKEQQGKADQADHQGWPVDHSQVGDNRQEIGDDRQFRFHNLETKEFIQLADDNGDSHTDNEAVKYGRERKSASTPSRSSPAMTRKMPDKIAKAAVMRSIPQNPKQCPTQRLR